MSHAAGPSLPAITRRRTASRGVAGAGNEPRFRDADRKGEGARDALVRIGWGCARDGCRAAACGGRKTRVSTRALSERTDEELMAAYARGERTAFDLLFARHAPKLHHVLVRGMRRPEDGKDLVQQTFLQLHRHRADYDVTRAFRPWLYTIALNLKRQYLRTKGRRPESELDEIVERTLAHAPGEALFENRQLLELGLKRLAPEAAEVVVLHWFGDLSMGEIATMLAISESAVKVRAHRAYEALRTIFEQERHVRGDEPEHGQRSEGPKSRGVV